MYLLNSYMDKSGVTTSNPNSCKPQQIYPSGAFDSLRYPSPISTPYYWCPCPTGKGKLQHRRPLYTICCSLPLSVLVPLFLPQLLCCAVFGISSTTVCVDYLHCYLLLSLLLILLFVLLYMMDVLFLGVDVIGFINDYAV